MKTSKSPIWRMSVLTALIIFGLVLGACQPQTVVETVVVEKEGQTIVQTVEVIKEVEVTGQPQPVKLVIMAGNEVDQAIEEYTAANPHVTIERVDKDDNKLAAMFAAGEAPDIISKSGADTRVFEMRGWILDLTPYFEKSLVLRPDDMVEAVNYFKTDKGWYGMHKDWSLDSALIINKRMADEAGIELPPPNTIITYEQVGEWAKLMAKKDPSGRVIRMGHSGFGYIDGPLQNILSETDQSLYSDDFSRAIIKDNPTVVEFLQYAVDLSKADVVWNPLSPDPNWYAPNMLDGIVAIIGSGFWVNMSFATAENPAEDPANFVMYPAASWGGEIVVDRSMGGSGWFISSQSKNPDEAFKFFEYYMGGKPAIDRAKGGWGLPALKSLQTMTPAETEWQKQWLETVNWELASDKVIKTPRDLNPYCTTTTVNNVWSTLLEQHLKNEITFEQLVETLDAEVNKCIADGMAAAK